MLADVELAGVAVPAGDVVAVLYPAANFDPRRFPDPLAFDLERQPNPHLTFATGPHQCLGSHVARLEIRVLFEELLQRAGTIELDGRCEYVRDNALRGIKRLPVAMGRKGGRAGG